MEEREIEQERLCAVIRFFCGENSASICGSLSRSKPWLYKWINRYTPNDTSWSKSRSRRPYSNSLRTPEAVEEIIKMIRLYLKNQGLFCGDNAIHWELKELDIRPVPSLSTINRTLRRHELVHHCSGHHDPEGRLYPTLPADIPNQVHQADLVGPCRLKGPINFYSLNVVDVNTGRCGVQPLISCSEHNLTDGLWYIWRRMGIPRNIQVDNRMLFNGGQTHKSDLGSFIRLCLLNGIEPRVTPTDEPWRNGAVKMLGIHYQRKFLDKIMIATEHNLRKASLAFEHKYNRNYRGSKLRGQTPMNALDGMDAKLTFPAKNRMPRYPLEKPESGRFHMIRYIRSDCSLIILGEHFVAPPETKNKYVVATIDIRSQKLKLFMDNKQVDEYHYQLP